jgi:hypothetical protein
MATPKASVRGSNPTGPACGDARQAVRGSTARQAVLLLLLLMGRSSLGLPHRC